MCVSDCRNDCPMCRSAYMCLQIPTKPLTKCAIFITPVIPISYSGSAWIISHPPWIKKFAFCSKPLTCSLTRRGVLIFSLKRWCPNAETNYIGTSKPVKGIFSTFHWHFVESLGVRSSWVWDFLIGFRCSSFEEGISMAFDSSGNLQRGPQSAQVSVPPLKIGCGRVGIPGNFRVLKVRIAEVAEWGNGIGWHQGWRTRGLPWIIH